MPKNVRLIPDVRVGQVYQDWDARYRPHGRHVRVIEVDKGYATVKCVKDMTMLDGPPARTAVGKLTRVAVDRMRPTANGYKLLEGENY